MGADALVHERVGERDHRQEVLSRQKLGKLPADVVLLVESEPHAVGSLELALRGSHPHPSSVRHHGRVHRPPVPRCGARGNVVESVAEALGSGALGAVEIGAHLAVQFGPALQPPAREDQGEAALGVEAEGDGPGGADQSQDVLAGLVQGLVQVPRVEAGEEDTHDVDDSPGSLSRELL